MGKHALRGLGMARLGQGLAPYEAFQRELVVVGCTACEVRTARPVPSTTMARIFLVVS